MNYLENIFNVKNKVAIITGGNGQLGTEYAKTLAKASAKVAVFDVHKNLNSELKKISKNLPIKLFQVDITKKEQIAVALKKIKKLWGVPSILINNAALDAPPGTNWEENKSFENYSSESWQAVMDVNLTAVFNCCQIIGGEMAKNNGGSVINISSTYGLVSPNQNIYKYREKLGKPFVKPISYSVTKSAILNLTRYLATYWADKKVRVNTLTPGGVFNNQDEQFLKNYTALAPMKRMANKDEYNGVILFLASDASSYMTGANLVIDGGWTAW
ncbi:MAG: short-chain dehydrogenase [Parcubacteria group bacterium Athens0714_26]|nr:MAG: short-chain dehydrogenase [Parcubacteria group bacterium Athens1014_26]TSD03652.1 MAG: short-chain dehydrogenase [Parcubacteria group bacterium Athens0714_26]